MHGQWSNPVYAEPNGKPQVIFPGGDGWIYALDPKNGNIVWKFDCNPKDSVYVLGGKGTRNDFVCTPVVDDNKLYIGVGQDPEHDEGVGHLWCIDITKEGDVSPELLADGEKPSNAPKAPPKTKKNPNSALVWHYGGVAPADLDRNFVFGRTLSTCSIHDGILFVGELAGYVHCLDAKTGKPHWVHYMEAVTWSSPSYIDGKVFFGNDDGRILVFQHGKEKKILKEIELGPRVRATPVAANGTLYIMAENKLFAIKGGEKK
jgi:outer membrane protein assembly factor BamB